MVVLAVGLAAVALPVGPVEPASASSSFVVRGSVHQVAVTGLAPGAPLTLEQGGEDVASGTADAKSVAKNLGIARKAFLDCVDYLAAKFKPEPNAAYGGAVPFLMLTGNLVCGWLLGKSLLVAEKQAAAGNDVDFMKAKIATARFYAEHILPRTVSQRLAIVDGGDSIMQLPMDSY